MKTISFERFRQLIQESDYIEIGDDLVTFTELYPSPSSAIRLTTDAGGGQEAVSEFDPKSFKANADESDAVFATDIDDVECEIHFYKGVLIKP